MTALAELVRPMLATAAKVLPDDDENWAFEFKWDGVRAVAYAEDGRIRLFSRNDLEATVSYPELGALAESLGRRPVILDGEIVAFDEDNRPSFGVLQQRMHVADAERARSLARRLPVTYLLFDVLYLDGRSTTGLEYVRRRELLDSLTLEGGRWHTPPWFSGPGHQVLAAAAENGLEGVVAKRRQSRYRPGRRSGDWLKVKHARTQEVVVIGWTSGQGRRQETLGALLLAVPRDGRLCYAGKVGTGFTDRMLDRLGELLTPWQRPDPPVPGPLPRGQVGGARWVEPKLVGEVSFGQWTGQGRLRHPVWRGLRPDKAPADVVLET